MTSILHLAVMARDAMPAGGRLTLEGGSAATERGCAGADGEISAADFVVIAVNASPYGISGGHPGQAFAELGMIGDFIGQSNGHIDLRNEGGRLASVGIYLPRASGVGQSGAEGPGTGGDEAILIVEDDALVRRYIVNQIRRLGCRTLAAGDANAAPAIVDGGEQIDLLFTDVMMPGSVNGRQLAIEARHRRPSLKVLHTSGYAKNAMVQDGRLDADVLLLAKPYRKVDLAKMIRAALAV